MSDYEVIPPAAIDHLMANPDTTEQFDAVFGKGRAAEAIAMRRPVPEQKPEENKDLSLLETVWDATGRAVGHGIQEAANEAVDSVESFDIWASQKLDQLGVPSRLQLFETNEDGTSGAFNPQFKTYADSLSDRDFLGGTVGEAGDAVEANLVSQPETVAGGIVSGISQFAAGYVGVSKFTRIGGLRGAFANGAVADAFVFDPKDANMMAVLEDFDIDTGALGDVLATDPDDPDYINRLRNVAEGALAGGIVEGIGWSIRAAKAAKLGDDVAAAKFGKKSEEALGELDAALKETGEEIVADAKTSLDLTKQLFPEADGQLKLDLGDTPVAPKADGEARKIFVTPERAEKIRLQANLAKGATVADKQAGLSFRSLTTVTDFEDVLDDIAGTQAVLSDEFASIKGGDVQRWRTVEAQSAVKVRQMAAMTGEDPEQLIKSFQEANLGDPAKMAAEIHARSTYLLSVEQELQSMAQAISKGEFDPKAWPGIKDADHLRLAFNQRREVAANLLAGQDALRSNVARAMNAMKIAVKGDEDLKAMLRDPSAFRDIDAAAKAIADPANAGIPAMRVVDEALAKVHGYMDKINTFRINALLSGPGTQEVNMISNVINSLVIPTEQAIGGAVSGDARAVKHAARTLQGYIAGVMDSSSTALRAGWMDDAILDPHSAKIEDEALRKGTTALGKVVTLPSRALMTMDEFFKQSQYRGRVFADAHEEAAIQGLKGDAKDTFIRQYLAESYDESGAALRGDALLQSRRATFTEPLDGKLGIMFQKAAIENSAIRFIVPFVKTPLNILSQTFQHVPIAGAISKRWQADFAAGGARRSQAIGKWVVGSGLMAMAGHMAATGQITGSGPSDHRIRKVWLKNNQPYSVRLENEDGTTTWVSFARLEPLSNLFSIAADITEITNDEYNESSTKGVLQATFMAVMENSVNKTFTQGVYDFMSILVGNKDYEREAALRNMIASFVPSAINQTNGDDVMREARSMTDAILAKTGKYNQVDPKRNVLGEPIVRRLPKYDPLGLTVEDRRETDTVLEEVTRVAIMNQTVADNPAKRIAGPNRIDLTTIKYSETQTLYDRWVELTGETKIAGKTLRETLEKTMASRAYRVAPDGFIGATSGTKGTIVGKIITSFRKKAQSEIPELVELIKSERRGGGEMLKQQYQSNRALFPDAETIKPNAGRRSFEDLLNN